ncbi:hypothetical protein DEO72_LG11g2465 [Vigna unguiculata]|uniref:Uncharacterized protein n=1 Tax=Vigna unguiculata TaxID=3917 RepID=A0A4D6NRZ6_VIGUN|nr:hypothetical protein DEO72_LG11g2465 [Vigna unguiculata]
MNININIKTLTEAPIHTSMNINDNIKSRVADEKQTPLSRFSSLLLLPACETTSMTIAADAAGSVCDHCLERRSRSVYDRRSVYDHRRERRCRRCSTIPFREKESHCDWVCNHHTATLHRPDLQLAGDDFLSSLFLFRLKDDGKKKKRSEGRKGDKIRKDFQHSFEQQ